MLFALPVMPFGSFLFFPVGLPARHPNLGDSANQVIVGFRRGIC